MSAKANLAAKTSLAVNSMEYCGCQFDERDIGIRLSGGRGHGEMIPLHPK
jgi:hypothetical protein